MVLLLGCNVLVGRIITRTYEYVGKLVEGGRVTEAISAAGELEISITRNDAYLFLQSCTKDLELARRVQFLILYSGLDYISVLGDHLIRLFASEASLLEANQAFNKVSNPTAHTWAAITAANAKLGQGNEALEFHVSMHLSGAKIDKHVYIAMLKACRMLPSLLQGRRIHQYIIKSGLQLDVVVGNAVVDMYAKCGDLDEACKVFDALPNRDVISWNAMITGYTQHRKAFVAQIYFERMQEEGIEPDVVSWSAVIEGHAHHGEGFLALQCFQKMEETGVRPNEITFLSVLKACASIAATYQGKLIHVQIIKKEYCSNVVLASTLLDMYAKCGNLEDARIIFDRLLNCDVVSWNAMIAGYAQHGEGIVALNCYRAMQQTGIHPVAVTFLSILKACASIGVIEMGKLIHVSIIQFKLCKDLVVGNTLIDTYVRCGSLHEAWKIFDKLPSRDVVSWNAIIAGYAQEGEGYLALQYFNTMACEDIIPDRATFLSIMKACSIVGALEQGRLMHEMIIKSGLQFDILVGSTLIDMYAKCGGLKEAHAVFVNLPNRDVVSWGAMVAGYAHNGECVNALRCFEKLQEEGLKPTIVIFLGVLKACAGMPSIEHGRLMHQEIIKSQIQLDVILGSALVDMYAKCRCMDDARKVFDELPERNAVSWGTIIAGYVEIGKDLLALECFDDMQQQGVKPEEVTFLNVLKACANAGAIGQGRTVHGKILKDGFHVDLVMWNTLINMYAKCGSVTEAQQMFDNLPNRSWVSWNAMIAGYAQHGEASLALECFKKMQQDGIQPDDVSFTSILIACSRSGLLDEGHSYFIFMGEYTSVTPTLLHSTSMVDLLGRAGLLNEAQDVLLCSFQFNINGWMSLLSACRVHGNMELARSCFEQILFLGLSA